MYEDKPYYFVKILCIERPPYVYIAGGFTKFLPFEVLHVLKATASDAHTNDSNIQKYLMKLVDSVCVYTTFSITKLSFFAAHEPRLKHTTLTVHCVCVCAVCECWSYSAVSL